MRPHRPAPHTTRIGGLAVVLCTITMLLGCTVAQEEPVTESSARTSDPAPLKYVALGDSYASGFGAGSYTEECGRSPFGLPGLLSQEPGIDLVLDATCAGARAVSEPGGPVDLPEQMTQALDAGAFGPDTGLVTLSAGGNDAGFAEIAGVCSSEPEEVCVEAIGARNAASLPVLAQDLDALYGRIRDAAPEATVLVTGYPHLFSPEFGVAVLPRASQEAFNAGTDDLNGVIRERAEAHGFFFIDLVPAFDGHGLGSEDSWITFREGAEDNLHPTIEGYRSGYLVAVRQSAALEDLPR